MNALRAGLYHALAEALADPPEWLARPGCEWPLFESAAGLASSSAAARRAVESLAEVRGESIAARRARYTALFLGPGRPRLCLHESAALSGRLLGPETLAVEKMYRSAGLESIDAELPDHVSLELAFLAHAAAGGHASLERRFIEQHAGRWLPDLGRALARSGDRVYAPIGQLLAGWLTERVHPSRARASANGLRVPAMSQAAACTLCGFCAQVCPAHALVVCETHDTTALLLATTVCVSCGKCERFCEARALRMRAPGEERRAEPEWLVLHRSPRAHCRGCGEPTVSRAELDFVAAKIDQPVWLEYCPGCRQQIVENLR